MRMTWALIGLTLTLAIPAQAETVALPVPSVLIKAGELLTNGQLVDRRMVVNDVAARNYAIAREQVAGFVARRALAAGAPIPLSAIRRPWVFREGERVVVQFAVEGLRIRGAGVALAPGVVGEEAAVRNFDTGVTVRGLVSADGVVNVGEDR